MFMAHRDSEVRQNRLMGQEGHGDGQRATQKRDKPPPGEQWEGRWDEGTQRADTTLGRLP